MASQNNELVRQMSRPLAQGRGWIKLVATLAILYGVMIALTIVGLLVAWLPIWIGIALFQSASAIEEAGVTGDPEAMLRAMNKLKSYFTIMGVLTLIGLLFFAAAMLLGFAGGMMGAMGHRGF